MFYLVIFLNGVQNVYYNLYHLKKLRKLDTNEKANNVTLTAPSTASKQTDLFLCFSPSITNTHSLRVQSFRGVNQQSSTAFSAVMQIYSMICSLALYFSKCMKHLGMLAILCCELIIHHLSALNCFFHLLVFKYSKPFLIYPHFSCYLPFLSHQQLTLSSCYPYCNFPDQISTLVLQVFQMLNTKNQINFLISKKLDFYELN